MATKSNKAADTESTETTEEVSTKLTLVVIGSCLVRHGSAKLKHGDEFEIDESELSLQAIKYLFVSKAVKIKDNDTQTNAIIASALAKAKPDPDAGKSREQLEDGGEIK